MKLAFLKQKKAEAVAKAQAIHDLAARENRVTTAEEDQQFAAHMAEAKSYDSKIADAQALLDAERSAPSVPAAQAQASNGTVPGVVVGHNNNEDKPWENLAEQLAAVKAATLGTSIADPRLFGAASGGNTTTPAEGGFLVFPEFSRQLVKRSFEVGVIADRCYKFPMASNRLVMNGVRDENRTDGNRWGGIQTFWTAEAGNYTSSKPTFREIAFQTDKLTAVVYATDEQMEDGPAFNAYVQEAVPDEISFKTDDSILNGPAAGGGPLGINNSGAIVVVSKESGQTGNTIVTANILKMYKRMPSYLRAGAAWYINQDTEDQLWNLTIGSGTAVRLLYSPPGVNGNSGPNGYMLGLPVLPIEQAQTAGTQGDITLAAFSQYGLGQRGGVKQDTSIHVAFLTGQQAFRFQVRLAGSSFWDKPVTPKNGSTTLSPFVQLQSRP